MSQTDDTDTDPIDNLATELESTLTNEDNDIALRVATGPSRFLWAAGKEGHCAVLEQTRKGAWYPRPTIETYEQAAHSIWADKPNHTDGVELREIPVPEIPTEDTN